MSSSENKTPNLLTQLTRSNSTNLDFSKFIEPLVLSSKSSSTASTISASSMGLKTLPIGSDEKLTSIQFGKPSNNSTSSSSGGSALTSLLSQTASGGVASVVGGGLSSIAGLGGLVSQISNLFGSKSAPPPLVLFSLPNSVQQTAYVGSNGTSVYAGDSVAQSAKPTCGSGIYTSGGVGNNSNRVVTQAPADRAAIAQAVKSALLTSSTLGDVITEL